MWRCIIPHSSWLILEDKNSSQSPFCGRKLMIITYKMGYRGVRSIFLLYSGTIWYNQQNLALFSYLVGVIGQKGNVRENQEMMEENSISSIKPTDTRRDKWYLAKITWVWLKYSLLRGLGGFQTFPPPRGWVFGTLKVVFQWPNIQVYSVSVGFMVYTTTNHEFYP